MRYNHLMVGASVVWLLLGLSFIVNGPWILSFYGIDLSIPVEPHLTAMTGPDPLLVGIAFMRVLGSMLIGLGVLAWLVRRVDDIDLQSSIILGFFVLSSLAFLAVFLQHVQVGMVLPQLRGSSARMLVVLLLLMSVTLGYYRFVKLNSR